MTPPRHRHRVAPRLRAKDCARVPFLSSTVDLTVNPTAAHSCTPGLRELPDDDVDGLAAHWARETLGLEILSTLEAAAHVARIAMHERGIARLVHANDAHCLIGRGRRMGRWGGGHIGGRADAWAAGWLDRCTCCGGEAVALF